jgi:tetratricopeptide (TPR) repeat protein
MRGRESWGLRDAAGAERAAGLFRRALEFDSRFARAWVGLADACLLRTATGAASIGRELAEAKDAVEHALACDPELGEAHATLGLIATFFEPNAAAAARAYRRAVELSPGYATAHQWYGNWLCGYGRVEEGLAELALAVDLDPLAPVLYDSLGLALYHAGRIDEAVEPFNQALELDPGFWRAHVSMALCEAARNRLENAAAELVAAWAGGAYGATAAEAREAADRLRGGPVPALDYMLGQARSRMRRVPSARIIEILLLMMLDREDETVDVLEAARAEGAVGFVLMFAPVLDPLASRSRFRHLRADVGHTLPRWRIGG